MNVTRLCEENKRSGPVTMAQNSTSHLHVLLLDDDAESRGAMKRELMEHGVQAVREADDPVEALSIMRLERIDVVVTERYLPFVRFLRSSRKSRESHVPIVMTSRRHRKADVLEARDAGINGFVAKPADPRQLVAEILKVAGENRLFIESEDYAGPDRRHWLDGDSVGDPVDESLGNDEGTPLLTEEEIKALLQP